MVEIFNLSFAIIVAMFADAVIKITWQWEKKPHKYDYFPKDCIEDSLSKYFQIAS